jgi:hypothetical protein
VGSVPDPKLLKDPAAASFLEPFDGADVRLLLKGRVEKKRISLGLELSRRLGRWRD